MSRLPGILLFAIVCGPGTGSALGGQLDKAEQALASGEYGTALSLFRQFAALGDPEAMIGLGRMHRDGLGVKKNRKTALDWFQKGGLVWRTRAKQGDPRAHAALGVLFNKGIGFQKDTDRARRYFRTAFDLAQPQALQGDPDSQHLIGMLYSSGKGVNKDVFAAADWLTKAGEGGHETAMKMLVHIFECGCRGLPRDTDKSRYWRARQAAIK